MPPSRPSRASRPRAACRSTSSAGRAPAALSGPGAGRVARAGHGWRRAGRSAAEEVRLLRDNTNLRAGHPTRVPRPLFAGTSGGSCAPTHHFRALPAGCSSRTTTFGHFRRVAPPDPPLSSTSRARTCPESPLSGTPGGSRAPTHHFRALIGLARPPSHHFRALLGQPTGLMSEKCSKVVIGNARRRAQARVRRLARENPECSTPPTRAPKCAAMRERHTPMYSPDGFLHLLCTVLPAYVHFYCR